MRTGRPPSVEGDIASPYVGQMFGPLTILRVFRIRTQSNGVPKCRIRCFVQCGCGKIYETDLCVITAGRPSSCGCTNRRALLQANTKHGYAANGHSRTYRAWLSMKHRVHNPRSPMWKDYGGRGIDMCIEWHIFEQFLADMGECPAGMTLDRIDVNGNYTPQNCRWASYKVQMNNKRSNVTVMCDGETHTLAEWADVLGVPYRFLWEHHRKRGVPVSQIPHLYATHHGVGA